jgi:hypothetical protein
MGLYSHHLIREWHAISGCEIVCLPLSRVTDLSQVFYPLGGFLGSTQKRTILEVVFRDICIQDTPEYPISLTLQHDHD